MKTIKAITAAVSLAVIALGPLFLPASSTSADSLHEVPVIPVLVSNAIKSTMDQLRPQCEKALDLSLDLQYDTSKNIGKAITEGDARFDVVILNPDIMELVTKAGKIAPGSRVDIARATFGVGVRVGAPKPDIATAAAMKQTLLQAKKITYPNEGASSPFIRAMFEKLGIAAEIKPRLIPEATTYPALANVVEGRADLVITLTSEILPAAGLDYAGPVPAKFQGDLIFSSAISAKSTRPEAAQKLIKYLASPAIAQTLKANGLEPLKK